MTVIDANVLLYAYNADAPKHQAAMKWLSDLVESGETIALPWITLGAFVRIATNSRIWERPMSASRAFEIVNKWLELPDIILLTPGPRHLEVLQRLVLEHNCVGPLVTDAVLAAHSLEKGATLASTDHDFARFSGLRRVNPLKP